MLYHYYEFAQTVSTPIRMHAALAKGILDNPLNPYSYSLAGRKLSSGLGLYEFVTRPYEKPRFNIDTVKIRGECVAVSQDIVARKPFCEIRRFKAEVISTTIPRLNVLVVAPMSGHHATLVRDTIKRLLVDCDVWVTDWCDARDVPIESGSFDLNDYIDYIRHFIQDLSKDVGENLHVMAVCQPGPAVVSAVALMSEDNDPALPLSMTLMGSPIDPRRSPTVPNIFAKNHDLDWFERHLIATVPPWVDGGGRRVYPGFLQLMGFVNMNMDRHVQAYLRYYNDLVVGDEDSIAAHEAFYEDYNSVMDMTSEFYLQTIDQVFHKAAIAVGEMTHRGRPVRPECIKTTALMTIEGERDDISGIGQTRAAHDICTGIDATQKRHLEQPGAGHYGVFSGRRWRDEIAPNVIEFMRGGRIQ